MPLLILSRVSPPFLDFIESSRVTTEWMSLTEVLRGTSSWTPFVSPERIAGAVLVTQPAAVLATGTLAAAGLAGLCMRHMPYRRRAIIVLLIGLLLMCTGFAGGLGSPIAEPVRVFLDGPGAFLRNVHKFEPFIRLPLVLGVAHLLARVPMPGAAGMRPWLAAFAHPQRSRPVAAAIVVVVALAGAGSLMWTGQLAPDGAYRAIPDYWKQTASWLDDHSHDGVAASGTEQRALVVPGAPFADQLWGLTRDEPMQALAKSPWAVRDAIPLTPPGAIRALDSVQRSLADGRSSPGLAATLANQGIGFVVLRADLDPDTSRSARPLLAQQALDGSPGLVKAASFGPLVSQPTARSVVRDNGLRPPMQAVQIYRVGGAAGVGPSLTDLDRMPRIAGGPESLAALQDLRARLGEPAAGPALLEADARRAGLPDAPAIITDTPTDRETDFGRVDDHSSAIRGDGDPRRTQNAAPDYPVDGQPLTQGQWLLDNQPGALRVSTSGSAADATQPGQTSPASSAAAAFDGDPSTAWVSSGLSSAVGQWMRLDFDRPRSDLALRLTTAKALGPEVSSIVVTTEAGSTVASGLKPGKPVTVTLPSGPTRWVQIRASATDDDTAGNQFALGEVGAIDLASGLPLTIRHRVVLPPRETGTRVAGWLLTQELSGRSTCVDQPVGTDDGSASVRVRCASGLGLSAETPGVLTRALSVPAPTDVTPAVVLRPKPGDALDALRSAPATVRATGASEVNDPRGSAQAAVDGDPGTVWTAAEPTKKGDKPTLTLSLPAPQEVRGLRIVVPTDHPAAPTEVAVDLGTGPQRVRVGADGTVALRSAVTDHLTITVLDRGELLDVNSLGFASRAPVGIAEIQVLPAPTAGPPADRPVDIGCDAGIGITVSGQVIGLSVHTTAAALRDGDPVVARPCSPAAARLPAGEQELSINPGSAFTVESAWLGNTAPADAAMVAAPEPVTHPVVEQWQATARSVRVDAAPGRRVLSVPESTNPGWVAELGGHTLEPVVVDGWQQGWLIPAGESGAVTLRFRYDSVYRWSLVVGFVLLAALFGLAFAGRRFRPSTAGDQTGTAAALGDRTGTLGAVAGALGGLASAWLLAGWWGVAVGAAAGLAVIALRPPMIVVAAFVAMMLATAGLAAGPWHSPTGYHGFSWWVQLPALVAVSLVIASAMPSSLPSTLRRWIRALSRRRNH
ncbi:alpha-(1-_3)-arabinofuranosyltransferase domain-containing protein [Gordonia sp. DT219]|uniref:alpha-(1->3)-arabinofuranosyltransferase domain-containing protein n=1 Tax=Gordonia sp. DT219 TaxID=3416658 RepID=UPI003CFB3784